VGDGGRCICGQRPQVVDAAAGAKAVTSTQARCTPVGPIEDDKTADKGKVRRSEGRQTAVEDTPTLAAAAVAARRPRAALSQVAEESGVRKNGLHAKGSQEAAPLTIAAVAAEGATSAGRAAASARGLVVKQQAVVDVDCPEQRAHGAALAASAIAAVAPGAADAPGAARR